MGQYWIPVNLDRREFIMPHKLGSGLKLWEQVANHPGVGAALVILTAAMPEPRGGGDFDLDKNWHGPERTFPAHNITPGPMPEDYKAIAARTIGRWAGDRIALIGDYAENGDLHECAKRTGDLNKTLRYAIDRLGTTDYPQEDELYALCADPRDGELPKGAFTDITADVAAIVEHELTGKFVGNGWREFKRDDETAAA